MHQNSEPTVQDCPTSTVPLHGTYRDLYSKNVKSQSYTPISDLKFPNLKEHMQLLQNTDEGIVYTFSQISLFIN